jgi:hypothetical protein
MPGAASAGEVAVRHHARLAIGPKMNPPPCPDPRAARPARVLVAAGAAASAPLRRAGSAGNVRFDFVEDAQTAVEQAMAIDYEMVLLELSLGGIGAAAAADILRRAGAPCRLVALGRFAEGDRTSALFDHSLASPACGEEVGALIRSMGRPSGLAGVMDEGWIARECADLVAEFRAGLPATATALEAALESRDLQALRSTIHVLKGSAGAYGLGEFTRRCADIEADIRIGRVDAVAPAVASLVESLRHVSEG